MNDILVVLCMQCLQGDTLKVITSWNDDDCTYRKYPC